MSYLDAIQNIAQDPQDQAAWHSLWKSSHAHWFGISYSILGSADQADDAIQNAMLLILPCPVIMPKHNAGRGLIAS